MDSEKRQELISTYLDGSILEKDLEQVLLLKENDEEFRQEFELALFLHEEEKKKFQERVNKAKPNFSIKQRFYALGAILLIVMTTWWSSGSQKIDRIVDEQIEKNGVSPVVLLSAGEKGDLEWQKAIESYQAHNYKEFVSQLKERIGVENLNSQQLLFMGVAELKLEVFDEGISHLRWVSEQDDKFKNEADWYLGLALIKENNLEEAREILNSLVEAKFFKEKEAREILSLLSK